MMIKQLLTPIHDVHWLLVSDTVGDAFDHLETHGVSAVPVLDWDRRYVGTVTEADLRRHVARLGRASSTLGAVERRSHDAPVAIDGELGAVIAQAASHPFVPVIDASGKFVGIIDRSRLVEGELPRAA